MYMHFALSLSFIDFWSVFVFIIIWSFGTDWQPNFITDRNQVCLPLTGVRIIADTALAKLYTCTCILYHDDNIGCISLDAMYGTSLA